MSEEEIQEASGSSRLEFAGVYVAMREQLACRGGLMTFGWTELREAVGRRYKGTSGARERLIKYWQSSAGAEKRGGKRQADELPLLLIGASRWTELVNALASVQIFLSLYNKRRKFELIAYGFFLFVLFDWLIMIIDCDY